MYPIEIAIIDINDELTYAWSNLDNMYKQGEGKHIFWGIINNDSIDKVHISYRNQWELDEFAGIGVETGIPCSKQVFTWWMGSKCDFNKSNQRGLPRSLYVITLQK